jgi:hypothetical protein
MLSKLIQAEKRVRENGNEYYVCTFSYTTGDKNCEPFIMINGVRVLNPKAAAIRDVNLVKCLFPTEDETAKAYKKLLDRFIKCMESEEKQFTTKKGEVVKLEDCQFSLPLVYKTMKVSELYDVDSFYYYDKNGNQTELRTLNAVGYSKIVPIIGENNEVVGFDDTNEWDTELNGGTVEEVIKRNTDSNLNREIYWVLKKVDKGDESKSSTVTSPAKPDINADDDDDE